MVEFSPATREAGVRFPASEIFLYRTVLLSFTFNSFSSIAIIANEPAERRRSAGEATENSAARRMAYAKKFSIELSESVTVRCKM